MNNRKGLFCIVLWVFIANSIMGQGVFGGKTQAISASVHVANYFDNKAFTPHKFVPGVAITYRKQIDDISDKLKIVFGVGVESVSVKIVGPTDGHYINTHFNFTNSLGLYYGFADSYYLGIYSSLDIPFANKEKSDFGGSTYEHFEFDFRYLNINFSGGLNLGRNIEIHKRQFIVELHFKALGLLGIKSNDYWHYPEGGIPYYSGVRFGYAF